MKYLESDLFNKEIRPALNVGMMRKSGEMSLDFWLSESICYLRRFMIQDLRFMNISVLCDKVTLS